MNSRPLKIIDVLARHNVPLVVIGDAMIVDGHKYASLEWLRRMKKASGRPQDLIDLENLPPPTDA